jgi:16S rRNA (uracil1498-N3)-methyltransferase
MEPAGKAHAFVADIDQPALDEHDRHHLERVLRLRPGDELTVADGLGQWRRCVLGPTLEPVSGVERDAALVPPITIAFALVKGGRPELVVQKLTEIGVDTITPFVADRSIVRWDESKAAQQHARLTTVAREAAMQSRRSWLPVVDPLVTFTDLAARAGAVMADRGGDVPSLRTAIVLVGPEGGWSDDERRSGLGSISLGSTVLRAETAAIVAAALLSGLRSSLIDPVKKNGG